MTLRNTRQRTVIRAAFEKANRPLGAPELLETAKTEISGIGIATIYRNIKTLVEEGFLTPVELPGEVPRYEISGKGHHHHFHCRRCGKVFEVEACGFEFQNLTPSGFRTTGHEIVLYGFCPRCNRTKTQGAVARKQNPRTAAPSAKA